MNIRPPTPAGRAVLALGGLALASPLFALRTSSNNNFVLMQDLGLVVIPLLGLVAVLGALATRRPIVLLAAAGFALAATIQLAQLGRSTNWLGGNGSTFSIMMAVGIGLLVVTLAPDLSSSYDVNSNPPRKEPRRDGAAEPS